jgi:recombinational DNA repair protein (RecF pathway)
MIIYSWEAVAKCSVCGEATVQVMYYTKEHGFLDNGFYCVNCQAHTFTSKNWEIRELG